MADYSRDRLGPQDEDRLPWLEPVEEEYDEPGGLTTPKLIIWLVAALAVAGLVVGGFFWLRQRDASTAGDGSLIQAPDSYYKERPGNESAPEDGDEIVYSASKGNEVESVIDISGAAETPVNVDRPQPAPAAPTMAAPTQPALVAAVAKPTAPAPKPAVRAGSSVDETVVKQAAKPVAKPKPAPVAAPAAPSEPTSGSTVQLGAFSSQAKANAAWKTLSGRFSFLSGLTQSVVPVQSGEKTLYRLRASGGNGADICKRLRVAGESCSIIG
ncbi:SPOR domain-containing protein [Rhizorhabdus phycosphaerae]|uniref:SPOR domain-containing protein n=1 Tax=Rhizorhabdus phycosphaerae TaxID=2711156 RepID=UPI0013EC373F|nr:SPOR domain-containing protein [Rhizorhabdus phycosphaerae]